MSNNCFGAIPLKDLAPQLNPLIFDVEIKKYKLVPTAVPIFEGSEDASIVYKVVPDVTLKIDDFVNSFAEDVGIQNILKKVSLTGDRSILNQTGRTPLPLEKDGKEAINDVVGMPTSINEANDVVKAASDGWKNLDPTLKENLSVDEFLATLSPERIQAYLNAKKEAK